MSTLCAQNPYAETLRSIAASNRSLQALDLATEATKTENMSGLNLSNPQVDFAYQWGIENADKVILDVSQEFDFATLSGAKKEAARSDNRVADATLLGERMRVLAEADLLMTEVVYLNKLDNLYSRMVENARKQVEVLQKGLAEGSVTVVGLNAAKMELASLKGERQVNAVDLANARMRLGAMAGGSISWNGDAYMPYEMPADLSAYTGEATSRDPEVMKAREEIAAAASQEKLRRREGLPGFSLGYTSEMVKDDNHYGVSVGVSLPLWGNHGRVKAAKAARAAAEAAAEDARFQSEMRLRGSWQKAMALRDVADECRVLVVDDNLVNRKVARGFLRPYGFIIDEADSGPKSIECVKQTKYDIIFMDHMMPEMDGIEAVQLIRSECGENGTQPVIIALTANAMEGVREMFLENGFQDFITKPLDKKALNEALLKWIPEQRRRKPDTWEESVEKMRKTKPAGQ